jgi:hypothetical protein
MLKHPLLVFLLLFSEITVAGDDSRQEAWYDTKSGRSMVREANSGVFYATIGRSQDDKFSVYFRIENDKCKGIIDGNASEVEPIYVNGQLLKLANYCDRGDQVYYALTDAGREYVLGQFKSSNWVVIRQYDSETKFKFSAKGFTKHLQKRMAMVDAM